MLLPFLPSLSEASSKPLTKPSKKLVIMYLPNGMVRRAFFPGEGEKKLPSALGGFSAEKLIKDQRHKYKPGIHPLEFTETLQPLARHKDSFTLLTGLDRSFKDGQDVHAQGSSSFLTSVSPEQAKEKGWRYPNGRSLDHVIGDHVGKKSVFPTLEVSCNGYSSPLEDIYFDNISWYGPGEIAPSIKSPHKLYKRLFMSDGMRNHVRNVTDLVLEDAKDLQRLLGSEDRSTLDDFMTSVRDLEVRVDRLEKLVTDAAVDAPAYEVLPRGEYIRLMADLTVAALRMGLTNVATVMIGPERWSAPLMYEGVFDKPVNHHSMSHNQLGEGYKPLQKIDLFHMEQFSYMIDRMKQVKEVDGSTVFDNSIVACGAGLGDGATHQFFDLPMMITGGAQGQLKQGRWVACETGTPCANLWLTLANLMEVETNSFADSTGVISDLWT